jgi:ATP-dependent protease ClpP protease subunit
MTLSLAHPATAAEIQHRPVGEGVGFISIQGDLRSGDDVVFAQAASTYERAVVLLISPGGSALAGMRIGEHIRERRFSTGVAPGTMCASACALAWLGGVNRYMSVNSQIGFHAVFVEEQGARRISSVGNALAGAYAQRMGLSTSAIGLIVREDPRGMEWLTPAKARSAGISLTVLEVEGPTLGVGPADGLPAHFVTGLDPNGDNWLALKAGPDIRSARVAKLGPGTGLRVLRRVERWLFVELADGRSGWVAREYVGCCRR